MSCDGFINYYEVLGVPYDADEATIKKRYRELVRKFHPDVAVDKLEAHEKFVQIVDAYQTLIDPVRRAAYDSKLRQVLGLPQEDKDTQVVEAPPFSWVEERKRKTPLSLLIEAEHHMLRGDLKRALEICKEVIEAEPKNPQAYELLAEIFEKLGNIEKAAEYFAYAAQLAPTNQYYRMQVERLLSRGSKVAVKPKAVEPSLFIKVSSLILSIVTVTACTVAFFASPKEAISQLMPLPLSFVKLAPLCGFFCGFFLRYGAWIRSAERALFYGTEPLTPRSGPPMGLLVSISALFNFYFAVVVAILLSLLNEEFEPSVFTAFGICWLVNSLFAMLSGGFGSTIMLWGASFVFLPFIIGWMLCSFVRHKWWE